ncbi:DUF6093 family protein [Nocardioides sp. T2.26MG-1]|uniref:DUF6093 family protein n=1 Tax=Nocardioides sp. T2.26MG-1 TaxID=3041166 RepID=UPI0024777E89|nr:DUF6093 family protein [Nocardioides sp. T2.26MG-1]CAI9417359.1 hypothetical protein HIDPHFAB_03000 [Nocardioides sp. T2.26MG-1]
MRPRRAYGRPGTAVIPDGWEADHRVVAEKTHRAATVSLRHPGTRQAWSETEQQNIEVPLDPYWTGPARVTELATRDQVKVTAGDREVVVRYDVAVDAGVVPSVDDLVTVTEVDDAFLAGRTLRVAQVSGGSLRFERVFSCSLND